MNALCSGFLSEKSLLLYGGHRLQSSAFMEPGTGVLVLFDLDQTLVDAIPIYDRACRTVFRKVFGVDCSAYELDFAGKTLPAIIWEGCKKKGISRSEYNAKLPVVLSELARDFESYLASPKSTVVVLPGVKPLLSSLSKRNVPVCVVTGSDEASARRLLAKAKISKHFIFVVGGERARDKRQGIATAIKDAKALGLPASRVVFIGDSPREAKDALDEGVVFIGTATGSYLKTQIEAAGAKKVFSDLSDTRAVLDAILGEPKKRV